MSHKVKKFVLITKELILKAENSIIGSFHKPKTPLRYNRKLAMPPPSTWKAQLKIPKLLFVTTRWLTLYIYEGAETTLWPHRLEARRF